VGWQLAAYRALRPLLFRADTERIHDLTLRALAIAGRSAPGRWLCRAASGTGRADDQGVELMGLRFRNRIGLGAGFDKDGVALRGWAALGLGFVELGTVTPAAQPGNPRPRLFRLIDDEALVNRMGFNNAGADALAERIARARAALPASFIVGVNIGRGRDTPRAAAKDDYVAAYRAVAPVSNYVAINVSSPNTPGLRDLQAVGWLADLVAALDAEEPRRPLLVKLAPELDRQAFEELARAIAASPAQGLILSNTTTRRDRLRSPLAGGEGGLSGRPLLRGVLRRVERARELVGPQLTIVGSGGVFSADDAAATLGAGADLVQLWTGLVYRGPALIGDTVRRTG
jgi:dihydroorotate dehydrogenase